MVMAMSNLYKRCDRFFVIALPVALAAVLPVPGGLNVAKYGICSDCYGASSKNRGCPTKMDKGHFYG